MAPIPHSKGLFEAVLSEGPNRVLRIYKRRPTTSPRVRGILESKPARSCPLILVRSQVCKAGHPKQGIKCKQWTSCY